MSSIAPGKIIFAGEYVGIFGEPIVLTTVNLRTGTEIAINNNGKLTVKSDKFEGELYTVELSKLEKIWLEANTDFENYEECGDIKFLTKYRSGNLTPTTLAVAGALFDCREKFGIEVAVDSNLPVGAGLGSSASMITSVIGGVWSKLGRPFILKELNERVYRVEQILNGRPSGGDNSGIVFGGWIKFRRVGTELTINNLNGEVLGKNWWLVDGGKPEENSLEMIAKVIEIKNRDNELFSTLIERERAIIKKTIKQVRDNIIEPALIDQSQQVLEEMGVVGERGKRIINEIRDIGGHSKISGAGGLKNGVGSILAYCEDEESLDFLSKKIGFRYKNIILGGVGWRIEK